MPASSDRSALQNPVGVLALQGSFELHARSLARLGVPTREVRRPKDLDGISALVLPGGESTTLSLLSRQYGLFQPIRDMAREGLPMFGTCAGAILLGRGQGIPPRFEVAPVELLRNAYGTQIDSFSALLSLKPFPAPFRGIFIRAPKILRWAEDVEVLGEHEGNPVLVAWRNLLLATFHPELTDDLRIHEYFLERFVRPGSFAPASQACAVRR